MEIKNPTQQRTTTTLHLEKHIHHTQLNKYRPKRHNFSYQQQKDNGWHLFDMKESSKST